MTLNEDELLTIIQELVTAVSENQHELEHGSVTFTDARLNDEDSIKEAKAQLKAYMLSQIEALIGEDYSHKTTDDIAWHDTIAVNRFKAELRNRARELYGS